MPIMFYLWTPTVNPSLRQFVRIGTSILDISIQGHFQKVKFHKLATAYLVLYRIVTSFPSLFFLFCLFLFMFLYFLRRICVF